MANATSSIGPGSYPPQSLSQAQRSWLYRYFGHQGEAPVGYGGEEITRGPQAPASSGMPANMNPAQRNDWAKSQGFTGWDDFQDQLRGNSPRALSLVGRSVPSPAPVNLPLTLDNSPIAGASATPVFHPSQVIAPPTARQVLSQRIWDTNPDYRASYLGSPTATGSATFRTNNPLAAALGQRIAAQGVAGSPAGLASRSRLYYDELGNLRTDMGSPTATGSATFGF